MKRYISSAILTALLGLSTIAFADGHNSTASIEDVKKETKELLQTINSYGSDKKDELLKKSKKSLEKLDSRIDELESKVDNNWDKMSKDARKEARTNLKELRKQRNELSEWYGSIKNSSTDAWEHVKKGFTDSYSALQNAWEKAQSEFDNKK
ncbi:MAG: hypothetical protein EOM50_23415 [Erysipelotrichia bacterium]|jgi:archaellum component FlaC|nr:hypothetical protein [Aliarcobacter sp.]NBL00889.1 hypothetical protein [Erysipelotrichia bacterium]